MMRVKYLVIFCFLLPQFVGAAVTINEIAWMGDTVSANHEWIELHNDGPTQSVEGWTLTDDENLTISLTGSIPAGAYVVLERTSDDSAPGTAFLLYTGALKNTGVTLTLYRADGGIEDRVSGGENWETLGGDNTTKDTAQYTTTGWITAPPTPGQANVSQATQTATVSNTTVSNSSSGSARLAKPVERETIKLELPGDTLALTLNLPDQVFVNQPVLFSATPSGVGNTIAQSLKYDWNFGDTNVSTDKEPTHTFTYPGTYVVHVSAAFGTQKATRRHEITVLPVALSLTKNQAGDIQINNDARYSIDLSGYRLRAREVITIPEHTWILSRQTVTVPRSKVVAGNNALVALYDNKGQMVASILPHTLKTTVARASQSEVVSPTSASNQGVRTVTTDSRFQFTSTAEAAEREEIVSDEADTTSTAQTAQLLEGTPRTNNWPIIGLVLLLSLGCVVVLMQPFLKKSSLDIHEQSDT